MAIITCCNISLLPRQGKFVGCDGKDWSDDFINYHLNKAVEEENYEWANECKIELEKRSAQNRKNKK